jgi:hypothetical protein
VEDDRKAAVREPRPEVLERGDLGVVPSLVRCPFCHTDVAPEASDWVTCKACLARHHDACWQESGACSTCRSDERLVQTFIRPRSDPPRGSRIQVRREADRTRLVWSPYRRSRFIAFTTLFLVAFLNCVAVGIGLWLHESSAAHVWAIVCALLALATAADFLRFCKRRAYIELGPDELELTNKRSRTIRARRGDVGATKLERVLGVLRLSIDVGVDRIQVETNRHLLNDGTLSEPELEWLRETLMSWKGETPTSPR